MTPGAPLPLSPHKPASPAPRNGMGTTSGQRTGGETGKVPGSPTPEIVSKRPACEQLQDCKLEKLLGPRSRKTDASRPLTQISPPTQSHLSPTVCQPPRNSPCPLPLQPKHGPLPTGDVTLPLFRPYPSPNQQPTPARPATTRRSWLQQAAGGGGAQGEGMRWARRGE